MKYKGVVVSGYNMLIGDPSEDVIRKPCFALNVGDRIISIGEKGKRSSSSRYQMFEKEITYTGRMIINDVDCAIFKLYNGAVVGFDLFLEQQDMYIIFKIVDVDNSQELILEDEESNSISIFKAVFNQ